MLNAESPFIDLFQEADQGRVEEAFGRKKEVFSIAEILSRRKACNVLLVGNPGVGRGTIVKGLALAGSRNELEGLLDNVRIVELSLGIYGTSPDRFQKGFESLLAHLRQSRETILFIRDFHLLVDSGGGQLGCEQLCATLLPSLLTGRISCITTTTPECYANLLETEPSICAAFEVVNIDPMSEEEAFEALRSLRQNMEQYHGIVMSDEALRTAIVLSERYIRETYLPGKAIDVLDRSCSHYRYVNVASTKNPDLLGDASLASHGDRLSSRNVRRTLEAMIGIEIHEAFGPEYCKKLIRDLQRRIVGQSSAVLEIVAALERTHSELAKSMRPKCIVLVVGPEKSGKHYFCKLLANSLWKKDNCLILIDAQDFDADAVADTLLEIAKSHPEAITSDDTNTPVLVPGALLYITNTDGAQLNDVARLIRFIEKGEIAHRNGTALLLKECLVVFESRNPDAFIERREYRENPDQWRVGLRQVLEPAIMNMVTDSVPFFSLKMNHYSRIMDKDLQSLKQSLGKDGIKIHVEDEVYDSIVREVDEAGGGVVELRTIFNREVIVPVEELLRDGSISDSGSLIVHSFDGDVVQITTTDAQVKG